MLVYTFVLPIGNFVNKICEKLTTSLVEDIQNKWISLLTDKKMTCKNVSSRNGHFSGCVEVEIKIRNGKLSALQH